MTDLKPDSVLRKEAEAEEKKTASNINSKKFLLLPLVAISHGLFPASSEQQYFKPWLSLREGSPWKIVGASLILVLFCGTAMFYSYKTVSFLKRWRQNPNPLEASAWLICTLITFFLAANCFWILCGDKFPYIFNYGIHFDK